LFPYSLPLTHCRADLPPCYNPPVHPDRSTTAHPALLARARRLHDEAILVDAHCDTTQRIATGQWDFRRRHDDGHVDLPRLREGGVSALFLAIWAGRSDGGIKPVDAARRQLAALRSLIDSLGDSLCLATTAQEVRYAKSGGKIAVLLGLEGGHLIDDSLDVLREFHRSGACYLTLTHSFHTSWADSAGIHEPLAPRHGGLTPFGREVIAELNRLGMMVDVSHVSDDTFWQVVECSAAPIVATHSSCRSVAPHRRNLSDDMLRAIARTGGVAHVNFGAAFLDPHHPPLDAAALEAYTRLGGVFPPNVTSHVTPFSWLLDHFDHALQVVGPDHVGIGSDFDGVPTLPRGMSDCASFPNLTAGLLERGYSDSDVRKVLGENTLRVLEACQRIGTSRHTPHSTDSAARLSGNRRTDGA